MSRVGSSLGSSGRCPVYALAATGCLCVILIISVVVGDSADVGVQLRSDPQRAASALRKSSAGRYSGIVDGEQRSALLEACDAVEGAPAIFLTYANFGGGDDAFCRFLESTAHNGIPIEVLNWNGEHLGIGSKFVHVLERLRGIDPCTVVFFTDAFDILYLDQPFALQRTFEQLHVPFLTSAECGCWPFQEQPDGWDICTKQFKSATRYRYPNSGMWAARAWAARDIFERIRAGQSGVEVRQPTRSSATGASQEGQDPASTASSLVTDASTRLGMMNDQEALGRMHLRDPTRVVIDNGAVLFQNMHLSEEFNQYCNPQEDLEIQPDGRLFNTHTNSYPAVMHFNGGAKELLRRFESKLWYKQPADAVAPADAGGSGKRVHADVEIMEHPVIALDKLWDFRDLCPNFKFSEPLSAHRYFIERSSTSAAAWLAAAPRADRLLASLGVVVVLVVGAVLCVTSARRSAASKGRTPRRRTRAP